jgi:hypothetical protein
MSYGIPGIAMSNGSSASISPVPFEPPKELFRYGEQSLWSAQALAASLPIASSEYRLFSAGIGQSGQGFATMSYAETSLREGGRIPAQQSFDVFGIACHIYMGNSTGGASGGAFATPTDTSGLIANLLNIQNNGVLQWSFLQTNIDIAPVVMIGAGGGAYGSVSQNAAGSNLGHMNNGAGQIWLYRAAAVALPGQSTFNVIMRFGNYAPAISSTNAVAVKVSLIGNYKTAMVVG